MTLSNVSVLAVATLQVICTVVVCPLTCRNNPPPEDYESAPADTGEITGDVGGDGMVDDAGGGADGADDVSGEADATMTGDGATVTDGSEKTADGSSDTADGS